VEGNGLWSNLRCCGVYLKGLRKFMKYLSQRIQFPGWDSNAASYEYKWQALLLDRTCRAILHRGLDWMNIGWTLFKASFFSFLESLETLVHLVRRPLIGLLSQPQKIDDDECGTVGVMIIGRGNRSIRRKPAPLPLCVPQISYELTWARTRAAVGSWRLIDWAMARPYLKLMCVQ
jgi:hypothetical protein